jgi:hypothetical protein
MYQLMMGTRYDNRKEDKQQDSISMILEKLKEGKFIVEERPTEFIDPNAKVIDVEEDELIQGKENE